ncbi:hypothetical protein ACP4OV_018308 [Aristida adscensionis]
MAARWSPVLAMEAYLHALQLCGELQDSSPTSSTAPAASDTPARGAAAAATTLAAEPRGAEYVAALAAGGQARLLVDVATGGASASPASLATTAALAVAAARTGGRLVCVRRDARGLGAARRHLERLGLAGSSSSVAFQLGRPPAAAVRRLRRVDFAVVDGEMEDRDEVLGALDVDPRGAVVVVTNVFRGHEGTCHCHCHGRHGGQLGGRSVVLPIGSGMEVIKIGRVGGQGGAHMQRPVRRSRNAKRTFLVCE